MDDDGLICDHVALQLLKANAERDAAIVQRNDALAEKRAASVELDAALMRCDLAFAERDTATLHLLNANAERDGAILRGDHALAEKKAASMEGDSAALRRFDLAFAERDSAVLQLLKANAERDAAILERNNAVAERKAASEEGEAAFRRYDRAFAERDAAALKLLKANAERDAAILERNNALAEKKAASERGDAALRRCDLAFAERDSALLERDRAIAALNAARVGRFAPFGDWNRHLLPSAGGMRTVQGPIVTDSGSFAVDLQSTAACQWKGQPGRGGLCQEFFQIPSATGNSNDIQRDLRVKRKLGKDVKRGLRPLRKKSPDHGIQRENVNRMEFGKTGVEDVSNGSVCNSIPYCSCTGVNQPCYKWGNGGWQSACCTTMISMYPLPMNPKKRSSRLAGRKMSAGAFEKLLEKIASEGVNVRTPIDLKGHWAKHGTNRYATLR